MKEALGINAHLSNLKQALTLLPSTGTNGFEGLLRDVLGAIVGIPFRLSGGGPQFGIDGQTIYAFPGISFESKLYTESISSSEVMAKIGELAIDSRDTELWILAATSQIRSQLAHKVSAFSSTSVVSTLILDWSPNNISPLPVVLSMASEETQRFLDQHPKTRHLAQNVARALEAIQNYDHYSTLATRLGQILFAPTLGMDASRETNAKWLNDAFVNTQKAREKFGQPLSPFDPAKGHSYVRRELIDRFHEILNKTGDARPLYVLGDEGSGKSWLVAQSWSCLHTTPLFLLLTPDLFPDSATSIDVQDILISALIRQTGDYEQRGLRDKWSDTLQRWRNVGIDQPRLVVLIDGLNQRRKKDWARIVASFSTEVARLSGRLVVTVRTQFYRSYIERRSPVEENVLEVPEWTASERDQILERRCIVGSSLSANVAEALRNPRLLGIALDLLTNEEIVGLEELSVSRLLFEHIRSAEIDFTTPQPAHEFVDQLRRHAEEVLARVCAEHSDDVTIFDNAFQGQLKDVVDGRFFHQVKGDASRYTLDDHGLTLALGFAVVDRLDRAHRSGRDINQTLEAIAEPMAALDLTASVFIAAFMTATIREAHDTKSATVLLEQISDLQNAAEDELNQLGYLARLRPHVFSQAVYNLCMRTGRKPSYDRVVAPLIYASGDESLWLAISETVKAWLSIYSISPDRGLFHPSTQDEEEHYEKQIAEHRDSIDTAIEGLSDCEQTILSGLRRVEGNPNALSTLAFALLAGKPLEQMAPEIVKWLFANALVSDYMIPYRELHHVLRLNELDWRRTRAELFREAEILRNNDVSRVGRRTLIAILAATGGLEDAKEALLLSKQLGGNQEPRPPWRLVENYCASDPCDPTSKRPANINQTAQDYAAIDVSKVKVPNDNAPVSIFLDRARAAMARFEPVAAAEKHRAFANDVVLRSGLSLYHGAFELRAHNALIGRSNSLRFVDAVTPPVLAGSESAGKELRLTRQLCLALAFPFLTAREQFDVLLRLEFEEIVLDLLAAIKPLDTECFDDLIHTAYLDHDETQLYLLLLMANKTCARISDRSRNVVMALLSSDSDRLRSEALGIVAQVGEMRAVARLADSDWQAKGKTRVDETRYGSFIFIEAVVLRLIDFREALGRISPTFYAAAAKRWSENGLREAVRCAGSCMDAVVRAIVELSADLDPPHIELHVGYGDDEVPVVNVEHRDMDPDDPVAGLRLASETDEQRLFRHKKNWVAFCALKDQLRDRGCEIILDHSSLDGIRTLVESDTTFAHKWFESLNAVNNDKLGGAHNMVLQVASSLSHRHPPQAAILFRKVWSSKPLVRISYGSAQLSLDSMALWAGSDAEQLNRLRVLRLEQATSDKDLSEQVLAAHLNGKQEFLERFICTKIDSDEPAAIARAVMVAGLSDCSSFNRRLLKQFENSHGYIGNAYKTAWYSYERNEWARHWYSEMCRAETEQEFWRFSVLFLKVVDGRYDNWHSEYEVIDQPSDLFLRNLSSRIRRRVNKWNNLRKNKLFGDDFPKGIFSYFIGKSQNDETE